MSDGSSKLKFFSIGIVTDDKVLGSHLINTYPVEAIPYAVGEIDSEFTDTVSDGIDIDGNPYISTVSNGIAVTARWIGSNNRRTSPNVKKGEQVRIFTMGDTEDYLWESMGRDDNLRRGEQVIYSFNASSDHDSKRDIPITEKDSYFFNVDTINKILSILTSEDDGEHCKYSFKLDTKNGNFEYMDNLGNGVRLDSKGTILSMYNADGTKVDLNKRHVHVLAKTDITLETTNTKLVVDNKGIHMAGNGFSVDNSGNITTNGSITAKGNITSAATVKGSVVSGSGCH